MWKVSWTLRPKRPGWSGTMQSRCQEEPPGKASVLFLPMIEMDPTDMSCIYSTPHVVATESRRHMTILLNGNKDSDLKSITLNLGAFHTITSFLVCTGHALSSLD